MDTAAVPMNRSRQTADRVDLEALKTRQRMAWSSGDYATIGTTLQTRYGPIVKTFAALEPARQAALARDLLTLIDRLNRSGDSSTVLPSEYLEIVITRS